MKALLYLYALTLFMFISTDSIIFHFKNEENLSLRVQRGKLKATQPVRDGAGIPVRCGQCHVGDSHSRPRTQGRNLETQRKVLPLFRAQAPSHHKRLQATIELM